MHKPKVCSAGLTLPLRLDRVLRDSTEEPVADVVGDGHADRERQTYVSGKQLDEIVRRTYAAYGRRK